MEDTRASGQELPSTHLMQKNLDQLLSIKKRGKEWIILRARGCFYTMYYAVKTLKKFTFTIINHELLEPIIKLTIVYELYVILLK